MEIKIINLKKSMFTLMRPLEEDMFQEQSLWILIQKLLTQLELDHLVNFSNKINFYLVNMVLEIAFLMVIMIKGQNTLNQPLN